MCRRRRVQVLGFFSTVRIRFLPAGAKWEGNELDDVGKAVGRERLYRQVRKEEEEEEEKLKQQQQSCSSRRRG